MKTIKSLSKVTLAVLCFVFPSMCKKPSLLLTTPSSGPIGEDNILP